MALARQPLHRPSRPQALVIQPQKGIQPMAQAPANPFVQSLASTFGMTVEDALKQAQKTALTKQYDMELIFTVRETQGSKKYYDATSVWTGVPYPVVNVTEQMLLDLLGKFAALGAAVASGGALPPAPPTA